MSVKRCYLKANSRRGPNFRKDGSRTYQETWTVELTSTSDDGLVVVGANGLPQRGQGYPEDSLAVCTDLSPSVSVESELVWYVEVTYTWEPPQPPSPGQQPPPGPPSEEWWRSQRSWQTIVYEKYPLQDLEEKAFQNSAGDLFEQPPAQIELHRMLTVKQRRRTHSEAAIFPFSDMAVINEDQILIDGRTWPPYSALVRSWDVDQNWYTDSEGRPVEFWNRTVQIEFNPHLWHPVKIVDQGRRCKMIGKAGLHNTRDANGVLDGHLALLHNGYQLDPIWGQSPTLLAYRVYEEMSFSNLLKWLEIPQS